MSPIIPPDARLMGDGTIRLPERGRPQVYDGWIPSPNNPWKHYPETVSCIHRIKVVEKLPCCGITQRMKCNAITPIIPITWNTCLRCEGTEEGIQELQGKLS